MSISRTDAEIISQTNKIALMILKQNGYEPEDPTTKCYGSKNPRAIAAWETACLIQEELTQTDPNSCDFEEAEMENQKVHELKITPVFFDGIENGGKNFEIRFNDRNFKVNDLLVLRKFENNHYQSGVIEAVISYVLENYTGLEDGYAILGLKNIEVHNG